MKPPFIFVFVMSLFMSFVMGVVMSIAMTIINGAPFVIPTLLVQIGLATLVGLVVMLVLPVAQLGEKFAGLFHAKRSSLPFNMLQAVIINTVMTFFVSFAMTAYATGFGDMPGGVTFIMRWMGPIPLVWVIAYIATNLALPAGTMLAVKAAGDKMPKPPEAPAQ